MRYVPSCVDISSLLVQELTVSWIYTFSEILVSLLPFIIGCFRLHVKCASLMSYLTFFRSLFPVVQLLQLGQSLLITEASRSHSVWLSCTNNRPYAETKTHTKEKHPCPRRIRTRNRNRRAVADPRLRLRGHPCLVTYH
jgi:hypothetical protein